MPRYLLYDMRFGSCCSGRLMRQLLFFAAPMNLSTGVRRTVLEASSTCRPCAVLTMTPQCVHLDIVPTLMYGDWADWLSMNTTSPSWMSSTAMLAELAKYLPDAETLTKVLDRYLAIILDGLNNVEQSTVTLESHGVKQDCTVLALKIYEEDAMNIAKAVLKKAKDDTDLKKILEGLVNGVEEIAGEDIGAEEVYADFKETVEDLLSDLEEETEFDTESYIQLDTYVDKSHNIIGMKFYGMSEQDSERGMVYFYSLTQGSQR